MNHDPARLRSVAVIELANRHWHALEPVLDALHAKGFDFGTPVADGSTWVCEYGPFQMRLSPSATQWRVSMPVQDDNSITRALLATIDSAARALPGVGGVAWYKQEDQAGAPASTPLQS